MAQEERGSEAADRRTDLSGIEDAAGAAVNKAVTELAADLATAERWDTFTSETVAAHALASMRAALDRLEQSGAIVAAIERHRSSGAGA